MEFTPEIKKKRLTGIGGSEVPAILGMNKYSSPYRVWAIKTGREDSFVGNKYTTAGTILESAVVEFFSRETEYRIIKASAKQKVFVHPKVSFAIGMPDRFYFSNRVGRGILECKTTQQSLDEVPDSWFAQLQWYLGIVGLYYGGIAWLEHGLEFKYKEYEYDADFFDFMLAEVTKFWENHIVKDVPPDPINIDDLIARYPQHISGKTIDAPYEIVRAHTELKEIREQIKKLETRETELSDAVKMAMKDSERVVSRGETLFSWKASKDSVVFEKDRFQIENPDLYQNYLTTRPGTRRFLIK